MKRWRKEDITWPKQREKTASQSSRGKKEDNNSGDFCMYPPALGKYIYRYIVKAYACRRWMRDRG
jgi:hypothetical protein